MQKEMSAQVFSESIFLSSPLMITTLLTTLTTNRARMRCIRLERSKAGANVLSAFMVVRGSDKAFLPSLAPTWRAFDYNI